MTESKHIRIEAPEGTDLLDIAQAVVGPHVLLKAEPLKYSERTFRHYLAMEQSAKAFERAYAKHLDKILREVRSYAEKRIVLGALGKADGKKPYQSIASPQHVSDIRQLITDYHLAFIATQIGPGYIAPGDVQRLIDAGILPQDLAYTYQPGPGDLPSAAAEVIAQAYNYGIAMGRDPMMRRQANTMTLNVFTEQGTPRLSEQERSAREWASSNAANTIVGLGNQVADDFTTTAIEADAELRRAYQADIREELDMNLSRREAWRRLASELGHRTGDWARNFKRISATEKQAAMQEGIVAGLIEREGDPKHTMVAKQPAPDACPDCVRLHLTAGQGSPPRTFRLSELQANGTNVGRKRNAWMAVVGPVHPWCSCELIHVPAGWGFNDDGDLVPEAMRRGDLLAADLHKSDNILTYGRIVPDRGCAVRLSDPVKKIIAEQVIAATPPEIFDRRIGVTLICEDEPRVGNALDEHDLAYWTGNEIRVSGKVRADKLAHVLRHELGHSLNVWLMHKWGGVDKVRAWHNRLYRVSKVEGFVTPYAKTHPIENAAELTRLYLYDRKLIVGQFPKAFAMLDAAYRDIWRPRERLEERPGEAAKQERDKRDAEARGHAKL